MTPIEELRLQLSITGNTNNVFKITPVSKSHNKNEIVLLFLLSFASGTFRA